jgi:hypothetical protein
MRIAKWCGIASMLLAAACSRDKGPSTYSVRISGARAASFNGEGAAGVRYSKERPGGTPGPIYWIALTVPWQVEGLEKHQGGEIRFSSLRDLPPGEYLTVDHGRIADTTLVGASFTAKLDLVWKPAGGSVTFEKPASKTRKKGTFRLRFISFQSDRDTIEIIGAFDVRKKD